jgi:NADPH:quinone reductase-like Zn-dependent oxidoreductase
VLIKIEAAGMNPMDRSMAAGAWKRTDAGDLPHSRGPPTWSLVAASSTAS